MAASYGQARQYERTAIRERGVLVINGVSHSGHITRIGGGGVFFEPAQPLTIEKTQSVLLKFRLACFDEPLTVKGEVRWVSIANDNHPAGAGIAFLDLDPKKQQQIIEFVAERGNVLCVVSALLRDRETDLTRLQKLLDKVDLGTVGSIDELKARVKAGMDGIERF